MARWIRVETKGAITVLTLDRQARRNAMHSEVWDELREVASELATAPPRVLVITGAGGHFSAGMDLSMDNAIVHRLLPLIQARNEDGLQELIADLQASMNAFASFPAPVIAAVEGACAGSGLEWALSADLVVAAQGAFFSLPETRHGMVPDVGGSTRLARRVGHARATDLILTGRRIDTVEASAWGLVDRVVPAGSALQAALELAGQICRGAPTTSLEALQLMRSTETVARGLADERRAGARALLSGEVVEGFTAWSEKRDPAWIP